MSASALAQGCYLAYGADRFEYRDDAGVDAGAPDGGPHDGGSTDAGDAAVSECTGTMTRSCPGGSDVGECRAGTQRCMDGAWGDCEGRVGPSAEVCDSRDNDCDGVIDGIAATIACGSGQACIGGSCVITMCPDFMLDCDMDPGNGCEADSRTDRAHCGNCDRGCAWPCSDALCQDPIGLLGGRYHTCGFGATGLHCWGTNFDGQLGDGTMMRANRPTPVSGLTSVQALAAGASHTCAIRLGAVHCWGANTSGQLGVSGATRQLVPVPTAVTDATAIAAGGIHTCAIRSTGQAFCWGSAAEGQLGDGTTGSTGHMARPVMGLLSVTRIAAGGSHTCAIAGGSLSCWGRNREGQVGIGSSTFT
ncbi:MAG: hypothetical protein KF729_36330, partial [Sandaracinaceae bacterium]|nr:hypothetical protein [Sandaracinaceae bacterium]